MGPQLKAGEIRISDVYGKEFPTYYLGFVSGRHKFVYLNTFEKTPALSVFSSLNFAVDAKGKISFPGPIPRTPISDSERRYIETIVRQKLEAYSPSAASIPVQTSHSLEEHLLPADIAEEPSIEDLKWARENLLGSEGPLSEDLNGLNLLLLTDKTSEILGQFERLPDNPGYSLVLTRRENLRQLGDAKHRLAVEHTSHTSETFYEQVLPRVKRIEFRQ